MANDVDTPGTLKRDRSGRPLFDIVAIAASAGGLQALIRVLEGLPGDFRAAIVIVQHLDPRHRSLIADIFGRRTVVKSRGRGRRSPEPATVHRSRSASALNPDSSLSLSQSELVHFVRPSADLLFESVAASYKDRAIAVVLTGTGADGAMGLRAIKKMGGTNIVQDQTTSAFFGMPGAAIETGTVDFVLPLEDIAPALVTLVEGRSTLD